MAADKTNKHKTRKALPPSSEPPEGMKGTALAESSQALGLAKKVSKKTFAKDAAKKSGKVLGKKVKRILDLERSLRQGKAQAHTKSGGPSPEDPSKIKWEPSFHLLTGKHLLEFVGEI